jgi:starch-binding outer membrane protein, SusD/RagB family
MKKLSVFLLALLTLSSCLNDFLDVKPVSDTSSENFWKTEADVRGELNSVYAFIQQSFNENNGYNYMSWYEARSDNFIGSTASTDLPLSVVNMNRLGTILPAANWNFWYKEISVVNHALYFIPKMKNLNATSRDNFLAEAHFLRAYCYFNLIRIWGDVPMVTEPVITINQLTKPTQTSKEIVMDSLILKDLKAADELVKTYKVDEIFRFSPGALYALYTDVAMWNHDYATALKFSQKLIALNKYELVEPADFYKVCGTAITKENIWTLNWSYANNGNNRLIFALHNTAIPYLVVSKLVKDEWAYFKPNQNPKIQIPGNWQTDVRRKQTIDTSAVYDPSPLVLSTKGVIWKWEPSTRANTSVTNERFIPLYRLADILLLRAEAFNQLGDMTNALAVLNSVRVKRGLPNRLSDDYDAVPNKIDSLETHILQERQFELLGEGRRWFDLIRTGRAMAVMNNHFTNYLVKAGATEVTLFTKEWQLYWPVFQDNMLENENLKQLGNY